MTRGYRSMKIVSTVAAIANVVMANAHPSRRSREQPRHRDDRQHRRRVDQQARDRALVDRDLRPDAEQRAPRAPRRPAAVRAITPGARRGRRRSSSATGTSRRAGRTATRTSARRTARTGVSRFQKVPVNSWFESIGSPYSRSPSATPISSGATRLPMRHATRSHPSAPARARRASPGTRTTRPRTISATSSSTQREVDAGEHRRVPARGTRRTCRPPATISHTSLPSHSGPIVLIATRRSVVGPADDPLQHPDAEVEPLQHEEAGPQDAR